MHHFANYAFVFVSCMHRKVVEGSRVGSAGCSVHVDVHGELRREWKQISHA